MAAALRHFVFVVLMSNIGLGQTFDECLIANMFRKTDVDQSSVRTHAASYIFTVRSRIECAKSCVKDVVCEAFGFSKLMKRCLIFYSPLNKNVSVELPLEIKHVTFYNLSLCENGGERIGQNCTCDGGFVGERCERLMTDCSEGFDRGYSSGLYQIQPEAAPNPFQVKCVMDTHGYTVVQWHHNVSSSFNRTWEEYRTGFGNLNGDHWIGNEHLYWITHSREFSLEVTINFQTSGITKFYFDEFQVLEDQDYAISFQEAPDPEDCLSQYNSVPFSTYDHYTTAPNCGQMQGSGWWYNANCTKCNLNGRLHGGNATSNASRASWVSNTGTSENILYTEMTLFRPEAWSTPNHNTNSAWPSDVSTPNDPNSHTTSKPG